MDGVSISIVTLIGHDVDSGSMAYVIGYLRITLLDFVLATVCKT